MRQAVALLFAMALVLMGQEISGVRWNYRIESPPRWLPGVNAGHDGIMVFVWRPDLPVTVCADYLTLDDRASRQMCADFPVDPVRDYTPVRLDFRTPAENFRVTRITVYLGWVEDRSGWKARAASVVTNPVAGAEYF